ncbi:MAG TPA: ECF transporter S component [Chloroflexota bacterium]|nr:ECF transporter S component [Chloroflexota bacterium]
MIEHERSRPEVATSGNQLAWRTRDIVVAAALAVPLGLIWGLVWLPLWFAGSQILPEIGTFLSGFFVVSGVLVGYVIRRPGSAVVGAVLAALIEMPFTPFGAIVLWLGLLQGLGVEIVFLSTGYRRFGLPVLMLAGAAGGAAMWLVYEYTTFGYAQLAIEIQILRLVVKLIGGAILAGLAGKLIGDALAKTGVLDNFAIARGRRQEI